MKGCRRIFAGMGRFPPEIKFRIGEVGTDREATLLTAATEELPDGPVG